MNQILLANHSTLLDLLEIPQLMDTYVFEQSATSFVEIEQYAFCEIQVNQCFIEAFHLLL